MPKAEIEEFLSGYINFHNNNLVSINNDFTKLPPSLNNFSIIQIEGLMNNIRYINKLLEKINININDGAYIIGSFETFKSRRNRIMYYKIPILRYAYMLIEFLLLRVTPKINGINKLYFYLTKGRNRLLSKAEMLGRLVCCGFEIIGTRKINGIDYFIVKKKKEPTFDMKPSYGPIFGMQRIGKGGKIFKVYKFRTMHPYSEYLQDYILKINGYAKSGKPANDFRLTPWGKFFRKYWIDELPQLFNILKGDMKLVGVRPVSKRYFEDIPKELQILRITQKPGCIPPYVSLNRGGDVCSVQTAEKEYLLEKLKNPLSTDTKYFFKAIFNILIRKKRSA